MELARALADMGGAARWLDLVAAGVRPGSLRTPQAPVMRLAPGLFSLPQAAPEVVAARAVGAQIGCLSACLHWQLPLIERAGAPHTVVSGDRKVTHKMRRTAGGTVHRSSRFNPRKLYADPLDAIDQAGWCTSPIGQVALLDAAIARQLVAPGDAHALTVGSRQRREWIAAHVDPRAESVLESVSRCAMRIAGLDVDPQVWFGRTTRVDFVVENKVVVETDGAQHTEPRAVAYDRTRDRGLVLEGLPVMRFGYSEVMPKPTLLVRQVCQATGRKPYDNWLRRLEWALAV